MCGIQPFNRASDQPQVPTNSAPIAPPRPRCTPTRSRRRARRARPATSSDEREAGDRREPDEQRAARAPPRPSAPIQNSCAVGAVANRAHRQLVVERRARREQVLEQRGSPGARARANASVSASARIVSASRAGDDRDEQHRRAAFGRGLRDADRSWCAGPARDRARVPARTGSPCRPSRRAPPASPAAPARRARRRPAEPVAAAPRASAIALCAVSRNAPRASHDVQFGRVRM